MKDATPLFLGVAIAATLLFQFHQRAMQCNAEYQGFKDGVLYGR